MDKNFFENKIKPIFLYIGIITSVIFSVAYIFVIIVMILGLESNPTIETFIGFLIANLVAGACISISLMIQGQDFAKDLPDNKKIIEQYTAKKEAKLHSITFYWVIEIIKVIFTRLLTIAAMTYIVIDICWKGNGQATYLLTAIFNLLMFVGFGSLGMVRMYERYNNSHIPWLKRKIEEKEKKNAKI